MIKNDQVPEGWNVKKIKGVIDNASIGGTPLRSEDRYWDGDIPWISSGAVSAEGKYTTSSPEEGITKRGLEESSTKLWSEGTVLVAMHGQGTLGHSAIASMEVAGNQSICGLQVDGERINNEYLYYWLQNIREPLANKGRGATASRQNLNQSLILDTKVPVPPLDEQELIVETLEERLERVERLEKSVRSVRQLSSEYENSIMSYVFSNLDFDSEESAKNLPEGDDVPEDWKITTLGDIAHFQNGNDFSKSQWENKGKPIIRIQNLTGTGDSFNYFSGEIHSRYAVQKGDILFSWSGTIDAFRWSGDDAWLNQHIYRVDTNDNVEDDYMYHLLKRSAEILRKKKVGGTLQHIRKGDVTGLQVPLPPKEEQREMIKRLESIDFSLLEKSVTDTTELLKEYCDSVLWYAFQDTSEADL